MSMLFRHKSAQVTLRRVDSSTAWIADLHSIDSTQLHTQELMERLVLKADTLGIIMQVDARANTDRPSQMSVGDFIIFYEQFGFQHIEAVTQYRMERKPQTSQEKQVV